MNSVQHSSNNAVLGAPADWDQAELPCGALPITHTHVGALPITHTHVGALPITHTHVGALPTVVSYWRPCVEELAVLNSGGSIALWVLGVTVPPVNLSIEGA